MICALLAVWIVTVLRAWNFEVVVGFPVLAFALAVGWEFGRRREKRRWERREADKLREYIGGAGR